MNGLELAGEEPEYPVSRRWISYALLILGALLFGGGLRYHLHFRELPGGGGPLSASVAWLHEGFGLLPLLSACVLLIAWSVALIAPGRLWVERGWTIAYGVIFLCFASGLAGIWDAGGTLGRIVGGGVREVVGSPIGLLLLGSGSWLSLGLATDRWSFGRGGPPDLLSNALGESAPSLGESDLAPGPADVIIPARARTNEESFAPEEPDNPAAEEALRAAVASSEDDVPTTRVAARDWDSPYESSLEATAGAALLEPEATFGPAFVPEVVDLAHDPDRSAEGLSVLDPDRFIPDLVIEPRSRYVEPVVEGPSADESALELAAALPLLEDEPVRAGEDDEDGDWSDSDDGEEWDDDDEDEDEDEDEDWDDDEEEDEEEEEEEEGEEEDWDEEGEDSSDDEEEEEWEEGDEEEEEDWDDEDEEDDDEEEEDEDDEEEEDDEDDDEDDEDWGDDYNEEEWNSLPSTEPTLRPAAELELPPAGRKPEPSHELAPAARLDAPGAAAAASIPTGYAIAGVDEHRYGRAVEVVLSSQRAAPSLLQRRLMVDFPTANHILDRMEAEGLIGPYRDGLDREIFVSLEEFRAERS